MKAIIVEDEINVRSGFEKLLRTFCPEIEVIGSAESVQEGVKVINRSNFDILFLDINLPDGTGFDLLHQLNEKSFHTIFVTAYDQYAVDAFKISAVDYLLKPISPELLKQSIGKIKRFKGLSTSSEQVDTLHKRMEGEFEQNEKIILRDTDGMRIVEIATIAYCEAEGSYTTFHFLNGGNVLTSMNLKEYERLLEPYGFIRSHHSFLINLQHITALNKIDGGQVVLKGDIVLPLSTRKKASVVEALKERFVN